MATHEDVLRTFITESSELLEAMEGHLLGLEAEASEETLHAVFRAAHTVKGSAAMFGLDELVSFAHAVESVLDALRDRRLQISDDLVSLLLRCKDHLSALIDEVARGRLAPSTALRQAGAPLLEALRAQLPRQHAEAAPAPVVSDGRWHVSVRFSQDVLREGLDPIAFLRHLSSVARVGGVGIVASDSLRTPEVDLSDCALGFELSLSGVADELVIEEAFALAGDQCQLWILPPGSSASAFLHLINLLPEGRDQLDPIFVASGSITAEALQAARREDNDQVKTCFLFDELEAAAAAESAATPESKAPPKSERGTQSKEAASGSKEGSTLRVDAAKLDHLINLVGELIIAAAGEKAISRRINSAELEEVSSSISGLVEQVRDSALQLRMVKIGGTFARFQRVVRDVARELGKDIRLEVSGEDTELDKTVVEQLGDPLMHLVRNSMDHGIESAERRLAAGKPIQGTVRLHAFHDSGSIVIEVSDDGGGMNRERILAKAVERGLVEPGAVLSDEQVYRLIFEPGFSTAAQVTNISGRGVGLDVVRRNVESMRGSVSIRSEEGRGSTVSVRLPLTLAIIDGFMVGLGGAAYVIPLAMVEECVEHRGDRTETYANLRGEVLPLIRLRDVFGLPEAEHQRESIVVLRHGARRAGLVVDALLGEFQTVIKPLNRVFGPARCISGSTILGSGEVGLILDVAALLARSAHPQNGAGRPPVGAGVDGARTRAEFGEGRGLQV